MQVNGLEEYELARKRRRRKRREEGRRTEGEAGEGGLNTKKRSSSPSLTTTTKSVAHDLCSNGLGDGFLSPDNDTLQLHDRGGGGDDNDNESDEGDDGHDDDVLQHVKDLGVMHKREERWCYSVSKRRSTCTLIIQMHIM